MGRVAREERNVVQVKIAAAIEINQATIARFEDGTAWPRHPEDVLMAYATVDVPLLWLHAFVLWLEHEPVLDKESQEQIRAALKRLQIS
jgi:predicted transcriptional regulator